MATAGHVSAGVVRLIEEGQLERVSLSALRRIAGVLGVRLAWDAGYRGAELARLRDADHAAVAELLMRRLTALGWLVRAEISFNHYGERGRIDLLAFHPPTATLLVVEIKTVIADLQALLGGMDVKERVARQVGRSIGFRAGGVVSALVVLESTTNRRRVAEHAALLSRFALRGRAAWAWLRSPEAPCPGLLLTVKVPNRNGAALRRAGRQRIRLTAAAPSSDRRVRALPSRLQCG